MTDYCEELSCSEKAPCPIHQAQKVEQGPPGGLALEQPVGPSSANKVADEFVQVEITPLRNGLLAGVSNSTHVLLNIKTDKLEETVTRTPLNLAILLDKSGSMAGSKLTYAKQAIIDVINNLREEDIVHLVVYDTNVEVVFQGHGFADREQSIRGAQSVQTNSSTNISQGLQKAAEVVMKVPNRERFSNQIFLFSDGQANAGIMNPDSMNNLVSGFKEREGIKVYSFGIGSDFDSALMSGVADAGGGQFYFLESPRVIPTLVGAALNGLLRLVGQQAVLTVQGVGSAVIKQICGQHKSTLISGLEVGDLIQSNSRKVVVELEANVPATTTQTSVPVLEWSLKYVPTGRTSTTLSGELCLRSWARDQFEEIPENKEVLVALAHAEVALMSEAVERRVKQGDKAGALKEQQAVIEKLDSVAFMDFTFETGMLGKMAERTRDVLEEQGTSAIAAQSCAFMGYTFKRSDADYLTSNFDNMFLQEPVEDKTASNLSGCNNASSSNFASHSASSDVSNFDDAFLREAPISYVSSSADSFDDFSFNPV